MKKLLQFISFLLAPIMNDRGVALNYAEVFQAGLAGQKFKVGVKFSDLYDPSGTSTNLIKFMGGKIIKISVLTVDGMRDHDRDTIALATRRHDNSWEAKTMSHDRYWETLVDPADVDETNMAASIGNITAVFVSEELFPEMDKYMASKLYSDASSGNKRVSSTYPVATSANVLAEFDLMMEELDDAEVPEEGRLLYVSPTIRRLLKNAFTNSRQVGTTQTQEEINRRLSLLDNVKITTVPSSRMYSAYVFTDGAVPASGAEILNMILVHPKAILAPIKVDSVYIDEPSAKTQGKSLYYQRKYWDVFLLAQKADALQINYTLVT